VNCKTFDVIVCLFFGNIKCFVGPIPWLSARIFSEAIYIKWVQMLENVRTQC